MRAQVLYIELAARLSVHALQDDELQEQEYQSFVELDQLLNLGIAKSKPSTQLADCL